MATEKNIPLGFLGNGGLASRFRDLYVGFHEKRESLGLSNPGTVENISREVSRDVFLNNSMFTGLRADVTKAFSVSPMFQTSHAFSIGSQGLAPYTFLATYGTPKVSTLYLYL
jgi:mitochondrial import receptor subunit TOM40